MCVFFLHSFDPLNNHLLYRCSLLTSCSCSQYVHVAFKACACNFLETVNCILSLELPLGVDLTRRAESTIPWKSRRLSPPGRMVGLAQKKSKRRRRNRSWGNVPFNGPFQSQRWSTQAGTTTKKAFYRPKAHTCLAFHTFMPSFGSFGRSAIMSVRVSWVGCNPLSGTTQKTNIKCVTHDTTRHHHFGCVPGGLHLLDLKISTAIRETCLVCKHKAGSALFHLQLQNQKIIVTF